MLFRSHFAKYARIVLDADRCDVTALLASIACDASAPRVRVRLEVQGRRSGAGFSGVLDLGESLKLPADDEVVRAVAANAGAQEVSFVY